MELSKTTYKSLVSALKAVGMVQLSTTARAKERDAIRRCKLCLRKLERLCQQQRETR